MFRDHVLEILFVGSGGGGVSVLKHCTDETSSAVQMSEVMCPSLRKTSATGV